MARSATFAVLLLVGSAARLCPGEQVGKVELILFTSFGDVVRGKTTMNIVGNGFARKFEVSGRGSVELPYGRYMIECLNPSFVGRARVVDVSSPEMKVVFGLALKDPGQAIGEGTPERWAVSGRVRTKGPAQGILVRLTGVVSDFAEETETDTSGKFSFETPEIGRYHVAAIENGAVIAEKELIVDFDRPRSIDVDLFDRR
jgi:hypothetical protein